MAQVKDVARYILEKREDTGHTTTAYALQKLLYYCQAWMLVSRNTVLFDSPIQAWTHGSVAVETWDFCRGRYRMQKRDIVNGDTDALDWDEEALVKRVLDLYAPYDDATLGDELERMSHLEAPWKDAIDKDNKVITPESLVDYFSGLQTQEFESDTPVPYLADISTHMFVSDEEFDWLESMMNSPKESEN